MIIVLNHTAQKSDVAALCADLHAQNIQVRCEHSGTTQILCLTGDTHLLNEDRLMAHPAVHKVLRVSEPQRRSSREVHPADTIVTVGKSAVGGGHFAVIAGPCSVESAAQMDQLAQLAAKTGVGFLRGGAFKPRTSPYSFQGLRADGLELLEHARCKSGLPIVSEIMDISHLPLFENVDIIQVGARNMQNFELLKALGHTNKPILLKRGLAATLEELVMSAEYILCGGNPNVILCERGIRTFEPSMRNTLDLSAVPMLHHMTHLPVIVDPSHAAGIAWMVEPLAKAAVAVGADGLMVEVHPDPPHALSDGAQSLNPTQFCKLMEQLRPEIEFFGKQLN